jgi:hypothetical protein
MPNSLRKHSFLIESVEERSKTPSERKRQIDQRLETRLRIKLDPSGTKNYLEESQSNIFSWRQTVVLIEGKKKDGSSNSILHNDTFSIIFERDIDYERPIIESFGHQVGSYNFWPMGKKGCVFQFFDGPKAPLMEIWFPPLGYYGSRSRNRRN